jgi:CHASE3 domain sensor protein
MKMNIEIDCSPEEARKLLGLPDVTEANEAYVAHMAKMMKGVSDLDQLQELGKQIAPMGQMGLQMFQQLIEAGAKAAFTGGKK